MPGKKKGEEKFPIIFQSSPPRPPWITGDKPCFLVKNPRDAETGRHRHNRRNKTRNHEGMVENVFADVRRSGSVKRDGGDRDP